VIFNLHVEHTTPKINAAADAFRDLIDVGIAHGGSYYLTYHRWARRDQLERCYPQMKEFLAFKRQHDPEERFQNPGTDTTARCFCSPTRGWRLSREA
jgi:hypothetical protein